MRKRTIIGHGFLMIDESILLERADCWFTPDRLEFKKKLIRNDLLVFRMIRDAGKQVTNTRQIKRLSA